MVAGYPQAAAVSSQKFWQAGSLALWRTSLPRMARTVENVVADLPICHLPFAFDMHIGMGAYIIMIGFRRKPSCDGSLNMDALPPEEEGIINICCD